MIRPTLTELVKQLDQYEKISWSVKVDEVNASDGENAPLQPPVGDGASGTHYRIRTFIHQTAGKRTDTAQDDGEIETCILIHKTRLKMTAFRALSLVEASLTPLVTNENLSTKVVTPKTFRVVWETPEMPLGWKQLSERTGVHFTVTRPGSAKFIGMIFGHNRHISKRISVRCKCTNETDLS